MGIKYNHKYSKDVLENIVKECVSVAGVIRRLGLKHAGDPICSKCFKRK